MRPLLPLALAAVTACAGENNVPFELVAEPEFVQGVIPGEELIVLIAISEPGGAGSEVSLAVEATAGEVSVEPSEVKSGEVAEVTYVADPVAGDQEAPMTLTISASRGSITRVHEVSTVVLPWEDTLAATASDILALFRPWLNENRPEFGIDDTTEFESTVVAPQLLVVSHYAFFNEEWELGLSWHIMVAPQDWAELYLRPRTEMSPTEAFRLDSWSTALNGGPFQISEIAPPAEVVR